MTANRRTKTSSRRSAGTRSRVATSLDLHWALQFSVIGERNSRRGDSPLPPQSPPFLKDLPGEGERYEPQREATQALKTIIEENYYTTNFEAAISTVQAQNIPELNQIKTLDQFYFYVDALVTWIPEIRVWQWQGDIFHERTVYLRITQFYYYFNQPELEALQSPIAPVNREEEKLSPLSAWMREFAVEWGTFLDTEESKKYLSSFKWAPEFSWQDFEKAPEEYATFNEFFARKFDKIDEKRPVASPNDNSTIVFPAESTFVGQWAVSTPVGEPLPAGPSIVVKHIEWPIHELLAGSDYASSFQGGVFVHSFLNTYDYHRLHTPVGGTVREAKFIPGQVYLQVDLEEQGEKDANGDLARAVIPRRYLDADDPTGYQFVQCRGLLVLENDELGKVAVLPIGMAQVSSVVFTTPEAEGSRQIKLTEEEKKKWDYQRQVEEINERIRKELVGKELKKGEMFSCFQFGGSDIVVVFERKANVDVTAKVGVHYPIRSRLGVANIK